MLKANGRLYAIWSNRSARFAMVALFIFGSLVEVYSQAAFNKEEFASRRAKFFEKLGDAQAIVFADEEHPHSVRYRESPDFYYLTGIEEPGAILFMDGRRKMAAVFAHKKPEWKVSSEGPGLRDIKEPEKVYGFTRVVPIEDIHGYLSYWANNGSKKLYVPLLPPDQLQYARDERMFNEAEAMKFPFAQKPRVKHIVSEIRNWIPAVELLDVSKILDEMRWVKTPYEIEQMRMAGKVGAEGVKEAIKGTRPGMFEYEIEAVARYVFVKRGARGDAFMPIVPSGPNTVIGHYSKNSRRMESGDVVYMDYGADYNYYTSDITRTWPVSGKFTPQQEKMYRCILEAREAIIAAIKPGATVADLKNAAEPIYKKHGFEAEFKKTNRYVGHFIGMSVHDVGSDDRPFVPGVVYNVEPLLQNDELKVHVRLEDTVLVTATGSDNLTGGVPASVDEIYALIKLKPLTIAP